MSESHNLHELHQTHLELLEVQNRLDKGPKLIAARQKMTQNSINAREMQKETLTSAKKAVDEKNLQLKSRESKIEELKTKLNTASSNKEFDIIKGQIQSDEMASSVLEDEILEALDKVDQEQVALGKAEETVTQAEAAAAKLEKEVADARPGLESDQERLNGELSRLETSLPGDVLENYRRLVRVHGATCLAQVKDNACTECYVSLSPQMRVELNCGNIVFCKSCGRLLYLTDES